MVVITLRCDHDLPAGTAALPLALSDADRLQIRLGALQAELTASASSLSAELHLAGDLWQRLAVPYEGIRLQVVRREPAEWELGPSLGILCPGRLMGRFLQTAPPFDDLAEAPGLFGLGYEQGIDWESRLMNGYVLDNRPDSPTRLVAASFPLPAVVRLMPRVQYKSRRQLRRLTGRRAFNSVASANPWRCHRLLSRNPLIHPHLPETRRFRSAVDLAALLVRHSAVLVAARGRKPVAVSRVGAGLRVAGTEFTGLAQATAHLRRLISRRQAVVQPQIATALRIRILAVQTPGGRWRTAFHSVHGAEAGTLKALMERLGLSRRQARCRLRHMERLALAAARVIGKAHHPLGILGIDLGVDAASHHLWLLALKLSPRWPNREDLRRKTAASQIAYGLSLIEEKERLP